MPLPKVIVLTVPEDSSYKASRLLECFKDAVNDCLDGMGSGDLYEDAAQMVDSARLLDLDAMYHPKAEGGSVNAGYNAALKDIAGDA